MLVFINVSNKIRSLLDPKKTKMSVVSQKF